MLGASPQINSPMSAQVRIKSADAFTLTEVMIAAGVMLAGVVGMIQVLVSGSEMLDVARKQTVANQIISSEINQLHLTDWTTISGWSGSYVDNTSSPVQLNSLSGSSFFGYPELTSFQTVGRDFKLIRVVSSVQTNLKKITITVKWTGNTGRAYSRSGSTYVTKNGLYVTYQRS
jgi:hypothetical protein